MKPLFIANIVLVFFLNLLIAVAIIGIGKQPIAQFITIVLAQLFGAMCALMLWIEWNRKE